MSEDNLRLIDKIFLIICKIFDLIDPETRKETREKKRCENNGF